MGLEKSLENKLKKAVESRGGIAFKFTSPGAAGVPDRLVLLSLGKLAFVEVKAKGKKPRPLQVVTMNKIKALGFKVYVLDDETQIGGILDDIQST